MESYITVLSHADISREPKSVCLELSNGVKFAEGWHSRHEAAHHQGHHSFCQSTETPLTLMKDARGSWIQS